MNWYIRLKKISQISGEWWIDGSGSAMYADGDIGEYNHEMHVIDSIVYKYLYVPEFTDVNSNEFIDSHIQENWEETVEWMISVEGLVTEQERQLAHDNMKNESTSNPGETFFEIASNNMDLSDILQMSGASEEEAMIATGQGDVRLYAAKNWGWVRIQGNNVEAFSLGPADLERIGNGLYDAYGEEVEKSSFNIYSYANKKWFNDVPYSVLSQGKIAYLRDYQFRGW